MSGEDDEGQRAWEQEMEMAMAARGRTRSRSILGESSGTSDDGDVDMSMGRGRRGSAIPPDETTEEETSMEVDQAINLRTRAKSFTSNRDSEEEDEDGEFPPMERRRSRSFTPMRNLPSNSGEEGGDGNENFARRAASLSKMYLVGSAPVDVSKLQDESKIVGGKKVEVVEPTGALSTKALDALSEGLQSLSAENTHALGTGKAAPAAASKEQSAFLSEAELEEKKMAEEEEKKLKNFRLTGRRGPRPSFIKMLRNSKNAAAATDKSSITGTPDRSSARGSEDAASAGETPVVAAPAAPTKRHKLKLLLLGDSGVGKTSLMRVFSGDEFSESMLATAGVDFKLRDISVGDEAIALQIWDTAGQERFHRITATYYKGANGIVLVYDVSDKRSFDNVAYWMTNIRQYASPNMPAMLLVGNKIDRDDRVVTTADGVAAAKQYDIRFIETSAKTSENTNSALENIARDAFLMSLNPTMNQKMLIEKEKSVMGRRNKENCVIQ